MKDSGLWYRCRDYLYEMSAGEWYKDFNDRLLADDTDKLMKFVVEEFNRRDNGET